MATTRKRCNMTDAIGRELQIGDFVTAVFYSGEVGLFRIRDFVVKKHKKVYAKLMRTEDTGIDNPGLLTRNKPIYKYSEQLTWVDPGYVAQYLILRKR